MIMLHGHNIYTANSKKYTQTEVLCPVRVSGMTGFSIGVSPLHHKLVELSFMGNRKNNRNLYS